MEALTPPSEKAAKLVVVNAFSPAQDIQEPKRKLVTATPFKWVDPKSIPPREWVYGKHYIRQFVSITVAPGGVGKSSLGIVEALAICTGRDLLGITPNERTKVWLWNGEDPLEELQRRVGAAMLHYGIKPEEVEGWLFLNSGRTSPIVIAEQTKDGAKIALPVMDALEATIRENGIGVAILDPFVSVHRVSENDNGMIDMVAKAIAGIADRCHCSFDLVHHVRKTNGSEVTVEDGRGAVSLLSAARAARSINQMTQEEADRWGVENRRLHFRYFDGKANLAPPSQASTWMKLESVNLGNETDTRPSDWMGVVSRWEPPSAFAEVTADHMHEVRRRAAEGEWRADVQSPDWIGRCVADVVGWDFSDKSVKGKAKAVVKAYLESGALKIETRVDAKRRPRNFVTRGDFDGG